MNTIETNLNAKLYLAEKINAAEESRLAKTMTSAQKQNNFFNTLRQALKAPEGKTYGESLQSKA